MTITIDGNIVHEQADGARGTHTCATRRAAQVLAAVLALRETGWKVRGPSTSDGFRLPLLLPGEKLGQPLDGGRTDERAQGFVAWRGRNPAAADSSGNSDRSAAEVIAIDASVGGQLLALRCQGSVMDAVEIVTWYLGEAPALRLGA